MSTTTPTTPPATIEHAHTKTVGSTTYYCIYEWLCDGAHHWWRRCAR